MHQGYIKGLDGLRAVAILLVMFGHISSSLNWPVESAFQKPFNLLTNMGWVGVQLFFVLSGFLITQILIKDRAKPNYFKNFYIRRSLRIFPIYYVTLLFFLVLIPLTVGTPEWLGKSVDDQLWFWTYLQNWNRPFSQHGALSPLWSLAIEEQYYLVWPLLVFMFQNKTLKVICFFMILSAPIFRFFLFNYLPDYIEGENIGKATAYNFTIARWDAIAIGSLIGIFVKEGKTKVLQLIARYGIIILSIIILTQIALLSNFTSVASGIGLLNQTTAALFFGCVIIIIYSSEASSISLRALEFAPMKSIGKISYSMYLFHLPLTVVWLNYWKVSFEAMSALKTLLIVFFHYATLVLITYGLALVSWKVFEHPILRYKDRFNS